MARRPASYDENGRKLLIEFCVEGVPLSAQTKNRQRLRAWQSKVSARAKWALANAALIEGDLEVRLAEFSEARSKDRDNVAKPILDAMQGVLFKDDRQVAFLKSEWRPIDGKFKVRFMSPHVATALVAGHEFMWVRIYRHRPREALMS